MSSFPRPLAGLKSALVASSSSSGLLHRTLASTSAFGARTFALSPARPRSYKEVQEDIAETEAKAKANLAKHGKDMDKNELAYEMNPQAKAQLDKQAVDMLIYLNIPPYAEAKKQSGFKTMDYLRVKLGAMQGMVETRSRELSFPMKTAGWLGQYAGYLSEFKALIGGGEVPARERTLLDSLTTTYAKFRQAELEGDQATIKETSEAPMQAKVLRDLMIKPRSPRVAQGKWEIVQHVKKPSLQSIFRLPFLKKRTLSHCLVRFNTVQQITLPPRSSDPEAKPLVRQTTLVENVLFERRDWIGGPSDTMTCPGTAIKAPWKVKSVVDYDIVGDSSNLDPQKRVSRSEMQGFGSP